MISGIATRIVAASFAMVFAFVTEAPAFGSPCPFHDPAFANLSTGSGHAGRAVGSGEVVDRHSLAQHHQHGVPGGDTHHQQKSHSCTCIGCGCCSSPVTLSPAALSFTPATISTGATTPLPPIQKHACSIPEHALPFSTAPPQNLIG